MNNFTIFSYNHSLDFSFIIGSHFAKPIRLSLFNEGITIQTLLHKNIFSDHYQCTIRSSYCFLNQLIFSASHCHTILSALKNISRQKDSLFSISHLLSLPDPPASLYKKAKIKNQSSAMIKYLPPAHPILQPYNRSTHSFPCPLPLYSFPFLFSSRFPTSTLPVPTLPARS